MQSGPCGRARRHALRRSSCAGRWRARSRYVYLRRRCPQTRRHGHGLRPLGAHRHRPRRRTPFHTSSPRASSTRSSDSATRTRRIGCGRWSSSAASATAACPNLRRGDAAAGSVSSHRRLRPRRARRRGRRCRTEAQATVNAYVAGVNAFIATHHGAALPPEFTLLRFEPEPWTGADVLVWVKMMAWDLSAKLLVSSCCGTTCRRRSAPSRWRS